MLATEIASPNTSPADHPQPKVPADQAAQAGGDEALDKGAGHRHLPDRGQVAEFEMQADAEHQQDDADFGKLIGQRLIGDEARRVGTDDQPGQQIADDRREPQALRQITQHDRRRESAGQRQQQVEFVHKDFVRLVVHADSHAAAGRQRIEKHLAVGLGRRRADRGSRPARDRAACGSAGRSPA